MIEFSMRRDAKAVLASGVLVVMSLLITTNVLSNVAVGDSVPSDSSCTDSVVDSGVNCSVQVHDSGSALDTAIDTGFDPSLTVNEETIITTAPTLTPPEMSGIASFLDGSGVGTGPSSVIDITGIFSTITSPPAQWINEVYAKEWPGPVLRHRFVSYSASDIGEEIYNHYDNINQEFGHNNRIKFELFSNTPPFVVESEVYNGHNEMGFSWYARFPFRQPEEPRKAVGLIYSEGFATMYVVRGARTYYIYSTDSDSLAIVEIEGSFYGW